jgi:hypothetical protein
MKNIRNIAVATLAAGLLLLAVNFFNILALMDIGHDYVSMKVFHDLKIELPEALPEWTNTSGEWLIVTISSFSTFVFLILNSITLWLCIKAFRNREGAETHKSSSDERKTNPAV